MVTIKVVGKLAFVKGIKEATHTPLKEAKDIVDEIFQNWEDDIATFDPKKFGWTVETLKEIKKWSNSFGNNVTVLSYE